MSFFSKKKKDVYTPKSPQRLAKSLPKREKPKAPSHSKEIFAPVKKWSAGIDWPSVRIKGILGLFCVLWIILWGRAWYLQMIEGPRLADKARRQHMASELVAGKRGMIFDRNGQVLAKSVEAKSVYANPRDVVDASVAANMLAPILGISQPKLLADLSQKNRRFIWLKRKVDDVTAEKVRKASLPGIGLSKEYDRFYPFSHMAGQLIGFVGMDDKGLEGIENSLDSRLGSMPVRQIVQRDAMGRKFYIHEEGQSEPVGEDVTLTLDMQIQFIAEEAIAKAVKEFEGLWGGALVVDAKNGDILAWAQYPFFNPNSYKKVKRDIYRNRLAADALEPGSTFKPIIMAAALQEKKVSPDTLINCEGGKWAYKNFTIRDTSTRGTLTASKVLRYSSNIGMAKIGQSVGSRRIYKYLSDLGFGSSNAVPISNSRGILHQPSDWSEIDIMAASFGQSVSVTALQMAQAYLTILNHGVYKKLRLVMDEDNVQEMPKRIFSDKSCNEVMAMMRDVVEEKDGTGKRAHIDGIEIAGKTGTAQKADARANAYGSKRLASFVGFFPAKDPEFLVLVFVDEPVRNQYGGIVAAPAFREIASKVLMHTGILNESKVVAKKTEERKRGLKLAQEGGQPWLEQKNNPATITTFVKLDMNLPGHLAKASGKIPNVTGKTLRNAVELFARAGIVPEIKGTGSRVVRQSPPAGAAWPEKEKEVNYILWLSER